MMGMKTMLFGILMSFGKSQFIDNLPNIVTEGNMCGGMMPVSMTSSCDTNLECVYTLGPMIADAPGFCRPTCPTVRDQWGNCLPDNCEVWNDGCNSCSYDEDSNSLVDCTENTCYTVRREASCERYSTNENDFFHCAQSYDVLSQMNSVCCANRDMCITGFPRDCSPECASLVNLVFANCKTALNLDDITAQSGWSDFHQKCMDTGGSTGPKEIPVNCAVWYDGCNTCSVMDGNVNFCSRRMCLTMGEQSCREHHTNVTTTHETRDECFDGLDNDDDGLSDCDDPDCLIYGRCRRVGDQETGRECFDGLDNDGDGMADCFDDDCIKDPRISSHCSGVIRPLIPEPQMMPPISSTEPGQTTNGH